MQPTMPTELKSLIVKYLALDQSHRIEVDLKNRVIDLTYTYYCGSGYLTFANLRSYTASNLQILNRIKEKANGDFLLTPLWLALDCCLYWDPQLKCFYSETRFSRQDIP